MNSLHIIHNHKELDKCTEVIDGVYVGGFEDAQAQVDNGQIPSSDFKLLVGYASLCSYLQNTCVKCSPGWGAYQLAQEIEDKCWFVMSTSTDIILQKANGPIFILDNAH